MLTSTTFLSPSASNSTYVLPMWSSGHSSPTCFNSTLQLLKILCNSWAEGAQLKAFLGGWVQPPPGAGPSLVATHKFRQWSACCCRVSRGALLECALHLIFPSRWLSLIVVHAWMPPEMSSVLHPQWNGNSHRKTKPKTNKPKNTSPQKQ